ncbi:MAG TPA: hypothetical protein V6C88_11655 [Chroococcidiopsis sp.]
MQPNSTELKQITAQLLAALLSNPHVYPAVSDEGAHGQREQELLVMAIALAQHLIDRAGHAKDG